MPHIHEKIDFTAEVFIVHKNKVLLRKHDKHKVWISVGGHIELDEDPNQAAVREVEEEVGLKVKLAGEAMQKGDIDYLELIPPKYLNRHKINQTHEHVTLVYFATAENDEIIQPEREKSEDIRWFSLEDLEKEKLRPNIKFYAQQALKELGD